MFSETNLDCCSEESGTASYRVEPGASLIRSQAGSTVVIPTKRMTLRRRQACSLSIGCATLKSYIYESGGGDRDRQDRVWRLRGPGPALAGRRGGTEVPRGRSRKSFTNRG